MKLINNVTKDFLLAGAATVLLYTTGLVVDSARVSERSDMGPTSTEATVSYRRGEDTETCRLLGLYCPARDTDSDSPARDTDGDSHHRGSSRRDDR